MADVRESAPLLQFPLEGAEVAFFDMLDRAAAAADEVVVMMPRTAARSEQFKTRLAVTKIAPRNKAR